MLVLTHSTGLEGPSTSLEFLGVLLDTVRMEARLPDDKLQRIRQAIRSWLDKRSATVLSLVGLLQHAAKVVRPGRTFVRQMYSVAAKVKELDHFTRLNKEFRSDLYWWYTFINEWNGISFIMPQTIIQTDASASWSCGAFFQGDCLQRKWPEHWQPIHIMAKEMVPIVLSCVAWRQQLSQKTVPPIRQYGAGSRS